MRNLTIKREKSFVGCLAKMQVYLEDAEGGDLKLSIYVEDESGEAVKKEISCRRIGDLKNGEERTFEISEGAVKVFVIADKISKDYCYDFYQLPEGDEDISLSGRNHLNPVLGNPFLFVGKTYEELKPSQKKNVGKGVMVFISAIVIGVLLGYCITAAILGSLGNREKSFTIGDMSITLTDNFERQNVVGYSAGFASKNVDLLVNKTPFEYTVSSKYSAAEYAELIIFGSNLESEVVTEGDLCYFIFEDETSDGDAYLYYAYTYKSDDSYWILYFAVEKGKAKRYADDIAKWAGSVSFD